MGAVGSRQINMESIFHEKQEGSLCAQHCLNNLLQGEYFIPVELSSIAHQLHEEERMRMAEGGVTSEDYRTFLQQPSGNTGFFWWGDAREHPGGLLRLDPAFAYAEPPSSCPLSRVECLPGSRHMISACSVTISVPAQPRDHGRHSPLISASQSLSTA